MRKVLLLLLFAAVVATAWILWLTRGEPKGTANVVLPRAAPTKPASSTSPLPARVPAETSVSIIINRETTVPSLTRADVEQIYMGKKTTWDDGWPIVAVMLNEDSEASREFLAVFLNKSPEQYRAYWRKEIFSGASAVPRTFDTEEQILDFVARTQGAIGVVMEIPRGSEVTVAPVADVAARQRSPETPTETTTGATTEATTEATESTSDPASPETTGSTGSGEQFDGFL